MGTQFQHPYVFKTLFSGEEVTFDDLCEGRSVVKGAIYLDKEQHETLDHHDMRFLGKTGRFVPVLKGGGKLWRVNEGKFYAVSATKGYLWMDAEVARLLGDVEIDMSYFEKLKEEAIRTIEQFGSFKEFVR